MTAQGWLTLACAGIVLLIVLSRRQWRALWIMAGLFASVAGDWLLSHRAGHEPHFFLGGIACFAGAHLTYLIYFGRRLNWWVLGAGVVVFGIYFGVTAPAIADVRVCLAAGGYCVLSLVSLAAAAGMRGNRSAKVCFCGGIGLLLFSDTLIALREFSDVDTLYMLMMPTYEASQIVLLLGVWFMTSRVDAAGSGAASRRNAS